MDFTVGYYQAPGSGSFQPSVGLRRLHCLKVFLDPALLTTCLIKFELRAEANKFFISICQPFPLPWIFGRSVIVVPLRAYTPRNSASRRTNSGWVEWTVKFVSALQNVIRSTRRGNEDSSRQSSEQASGLPDKETFDMQVRTPSPWLHVGSMDDH